MVIKQNIRWVYLLRRMHHARASKSRNIAIVSNYMMLNELYHKKKVPLSDTCTFSPDTANMVSGEWIN